MLDSLLNLILGLVVLLFHVLLPVLLPLGIIVVVLRMLIGPILSGHGGAGAEFFVRALLWPLRIAWVVTRGLWRFWRDSRHRRIKFYNQDRKRRPWLAAAAQRAVVRRAGPKPAYLIGDDRPAASPPNYRRDKFDEIWHEHLRDLGDGIDDDE